MAEKLVGGCRRPLPNRSVLPPIGYTGSATVRRITLDSRPDKALVAWFPVPLGSINFNQVNCIPRSTC